MSRISFNVGLITILLVLCSGCRMMGQLVGDKDALARAGTVWNSPLPELEPPTPGERNVYVSFRNASDAEIELRYDVADALSRAGWSVVDDPKSAQYRLRVTVRYWGENDALDQGVGKAHALGAITGVGAGLGTAAGIDALGGSDDAAGAIGIGVGGLLGWWAANQSKPREWDVILDLVIEEALDDVGEGHPPASFREHPVRLTAWARQMNLKENEALPLIVDKVRSVLPRAMPAI